ncbi:hypothetical protein [Salinimicrobium sp. GXAS 041]|uniref:hypothetical protein n=1 Tax=Salinimicrobium sp. GXAS 041 TaxID=3400806 RepID=UPI003C71C224
MESTQEGPLHFIKLYLQTGLYESLKLFYEQGKELGEIVEINKEKLEIVVKDASGLLTFSFEDVVEREMKTLAMYAERQLENKLESKFEEGTEQQYVEFLLKQLDRCRTFPSYSAFPYLEKYLTQIQQVIEHYSTGPAENLLNLGSTTSFDFIAANTDQKLEKLEKLYTLLTTSPPLVRCEKEEFLLAFSGGTVEEGIHWLVIGKNNLTSKRSLLYFLDLLIGKSYLPSVDHLHLSEKILYVFRDVNGRVFKNVKQSKSSWTESKRPTEGSRIESIIEQL